MAFEHWEKDEISWNSHLEPYAWRVRPENLPKFLSALRSASDGGSWSKPYCKKDSVIVRNCKDYFVVFAMANSYPFVDNMLTEIGDIEKRREGGGWEL